VSTDAPARGTVFVTGAAGFIGSHLVEHLLDVGWRVRALVRYTSHGSRGNLEHLVDGLLRRYGAETSELGPTATVFGPLEVVHGDIIDAPLMNRCCEDVHAVCHLAALIGIPYSYHAPASYVNVNVLGTLNLLAAARAAGAATFVQTSTSEVYGTAQYTPIDLNHPLQAQSPYAATKIGADKLAESYARSFSMRVVVLRPFNTFGPRQSFRALIPTIIGQALADDTVRLGSTHTIRDFTYVEDTCRAFAQVLERELASPTTVHLGTGVGVTAAQIVESVGRIVGRTLRIEVAEDRLRPKESEVEVLISDPSGAVSMLGWSPTVSFEEGLVRTVEWFKSRQVRGCTRFQA
jgi:nucleoside-diphosphate-sugar epimerase